MHGSFQSEGMYVNNPTGIVEQPFKSLEIFFSFSKQFMII